MKLPNFLLGLVEETANHSLVTPFNSSENISGTLDNQLFFLELSVEDYCISKPLTLAFKKIIVSPKYQMSRLFKNPARSTFNLPSFSKKGI
jgi:hypothetical protein